MPKYFNIFTILELYNKEGLQSVRKALNEKQNPNLLDNLSVEVYNASKSKDLVEMENLLKKYSISIQKR